LLIIFGVIDDVMIGEFFIFWIKWVGNVLMSFIFGLWRILSRFFIDKLTQKRFAKWLRWMIFGIIFGLSLLWKRIKWRRKIKLMLIFIVRDVHILYLTWTNFIFYFNLLNALIDISNYRHLLVLNYFSFYQITNICPNQK